MKIKTLWNSITPFNNRQDVPTAFYVIKKVLGFLFIYAAAAFVGEAVIIGALLIMGYDPLNGILPVGHLAELLKYYGFVGFLLVAVFYCKLVEKRSLKSIGFNGNVYDLFTGCLAAVLLLAIIVGLCCATGALEFVGVASGVNVPYLIALFGAFFVQSMAEEVMSRGFLFKSLSKRASMPVAIIVSAAAFSMGHLASVLEAEGWFTVIGVVNLFLVSAVFALLYHLRANIYIVGGLHCLWNFLLYGVMGLSISGSAGNENALLQFRVPAANILNGGVYGMEAGIITTAVLTITVAILAAMRHERRDDNGV